MPWQKKRRQNCILDVHRYNTYDPYGGFLANQTSWSYDVAYKRFSRFTGLGPRSNQTFAAAPEDVKAMGLP